MRHGVRSKLGLGLLLTALLSLLLSMVVVATTTNDATAQFGLDCDRDDERLICVFFNECFGLEGDAQQACAIEICKPLGAMRCVNTVCRQADEAGILLEPVAGCRANNCANVGAALGDADCDGVLRSNDCNDRDPNVRNTRANDADCDGVPDSEDCDDGADGATSSGDADCDGVPTSVDCDDADPNNPRSPPTDPDCDGVPIGPDCNDADATIGLCEPMGLWLTDPYTCGAGFDGNIAGGTAPYTMTYTLTPAAGGAPIVLASFTLTANGNYTTPAGYINYATLPAGSYTVTVLVTDAASLTAAATFTANITTDCGDEPPAPTPEPTAVPPAPTPAPPAPTPAPPPAPTPTPPAPVAALPAAGQVGITDEQVEQILAIVVENNKPEPAAVSAPAATEQPTAPTELAHTGVSNVVTSMFAFWAVGAGLACLALARRRPDDDSPDQD